MIWHSAITLTSLPNSPSFGPCFWARLTSVLVPEHPCQADSISWAWRWPFLTQNALLPDIHMTSRWLQVFAHPFGMPCPKKLMLKVLVTQLAPTHCNPVDCSRPGSPVHGILQARILEWVTIPVLRGITPTQRSNLGLMNCMHIPYRLSHQVPYPEVILTTLFLIASYPTTLSFSSLINLFLYSLILNNFCIL